jgi:hypothetical protein
MTSVAYAARYFDEERTMPSDYVRCNDDGKFEAIATHFFDGIRNEADNEARERSLGIFDTLNAAIKALSQYLRRVEAADRPLGAYGSIDFNRTIQ